MKKIVVPGASSLNQSKKGDGGTKQRGERERQRDRETQRAREKEIKGTRRSCIN